MNKGELIDALRESTDITKSDAEMVVSTFFDEITSALEKGDRVEIRGLCSFFVKKYKGYEGRNPKTGETVQITPKKLPFFKCGKELKELVDIK
ncbi:MAG: integration host factor subunit beta [Deltaproteobacteria bacterium]|nr:integration host factor subunit beta [Deltaproteobacteria bacterium]